MTQDSTGSDRTALAKFGETMDGFVHRKPWWAIAVFSIVAFLFGGSGFVWSYLGYGLDARESYRADVELARQLQSDMAEIQREIIDFVPEYLELRDVRNEDGTYVLGNEYISAKYQLIKLVADYNALEARRSFVEEIQPRWFPVGPMIPPMAPTLHGLTPVGFTKPGEVLVEIDYDLNYDQVLAGVRADLKRLYEDYDQEYPSEPVPETR